jgi:hypothetical protein
MPKTLDTLMPLLYQLMISKRPFIFATELIYRQMMKAIKCMNVSEAMPISQNYDVIAIDEGQFFSDVNLLTPFRLVRCHVRLWKWLKNLQIAEK